MVDRPEYTDTRVKQRTTAFRGHDQSLDRGLPVRLVLFGLRSLLDVIGCIAQRPHAGDPVFEFVRPAQSREPSFSILTKKPSGIRGVVSVSYLLHHGHGAPTAPQGQAFGPFHGLPRWVSQTQPMSWQRVHFIASLILAGTICKCRTAAELSEE
jgi:hypothetical protein